MNSLSQLCAYLKASKFSFKKANRALTLGVQAQLLAPIVIVENNIHSLIAEVEIPFEEESIVQFEDLLFTVEALLDEDFEVSYEQEKKLICICFCFSRGDAEEEIERFIGLVNYCFYPLFAHLSKNARWNENLVCLAFCNPHDKKKMGHA